MSVRFTPKSFTDAFTTEFTKAVTAAAGKDGRLTKSEAQKLAARTDLGKVFADDAASFFESTGQKSVLVSKLIGLQHDAVLAAATTAAGKDGKLSIADAKNLPAQYRDDFEALRTGIATPAPTPAPSLDQVQTEIDWATQGMLLSSESDAAVDTVGAPNIGSQPITEQMVRQLLGAQHDALGPDLYGNHDASFVKLADRTLESQGDGKAWLDQRAQNFDPNDPASVAMAQKWGNLGSVMEKDLTDLQVFRFGTINITTLVVGRTKNGDLAGIYSAVVET